MRAGSNFAAHRSFAQSEGGRVIEEAFRHVSANSGMDADNLVDRSEQWTQACDFAYEAVRRYWDEHGRETFDNRMQGLEAWPPCHGSGDRNAAVEVTVAMRDDGYIARRAQEAILGCPAGVAFQHAAMLVTQLIADHRPAPVRAPAPVQRPRDEDRHSGPVALSRARKLAKRPESTIMVLSVAWAWCSYTSAPSVTTTGY